MSAPISDEARLGQMLLAVVGTIVVIKVGIAAGGTSPVIDETTGLSHPEAGVGVVAAIMCALPFILTIWWLGYSSTNRDDQAKVNRTWLIMMAALAAFHYYTASENEKMAARQNWDNAKYQVNHASKNIAAAAAVALTAAAVVAVAAAPAKTYLRADGQPARIPPTTPPAVRGTVAYDNWQHRGGM